MKVPEIVFLLLWAATTLSSADDSADRGCIVGDVDPNVDYFPNKVQPLESELWEIEYHNYYKIVRNLHTNASFLLYQCGSTPPAEETTDGLHQGIIEIPLQNVGVGQTVTIPYLDQLGKLDEIIVFMTDVQYVSSPCFLDRINAGQVLVADAEIPLADKAQQDGLQDIYEMIGDMVAFVGPFSDVPFQHSVEVSEYKEKSNGAIYEWLKFYAAFFNTEEIANEAVAAAADRYQCVAENAARIEADFPEKPTVLWGSYSSYCGGWNFAKCPNFYCEIANACSTNILFDEEEAGSLELCDGYIFKTLEEFVAFGKDADYWIYDSDNWQETYDEFGEQLDQIKAVQNKQVFDNLGAGPNKWYEERFASYYDLVQDFCGVVGTTRSLPGPGWFRNVYTEPIGDGGTCTEDGKHSLLPYNFDCEPTEFDPVSFGQSGGGVVGFAWVTACLVIVAALWAL